MTLPRDQIEKGFVEEQSAFSALVRSLDDGQLDQPTRCEGWTVRDVAAHVTGTLSDIVGGRFDGLGTPEVTQRQVDERAGQSARALADELDEVNAGAQQLLAAFDDDAWEAEAPAGVARTVGWGVESLWYDAFVHGDDIRAALGQPSVPTDAMRAAVSHIAAVLTDQGYPATTIDLDGIEPSEVSGGSAERRITGDPLPFILAGTGRADPSTVGLDETINIYR